jgi:hypothetical protein
MSTGTAVDFINTRDGDGVFGNLTVNWTDNDKDLEKNSFAFSNCRSAEFDLSTVGGVRGLLWAYLPLFLKNL